MKTMANERWLPVVGWEGLYEVSDLGKIRSLPRVGVRIRRIYSGVPVKPQTAPNGYLTVYLNGVGRARKRAYLHRIVLEAFVGPAPDEHECAHNDGDKRNCRLSNLVWKTRLENVADKFLHGSQPIGESCYNSVLTEKRIRIIRSSTGASDAELGKRFGVGPATIYKVRHRISWKHIP